MTDQLPATELKQPTEAQRVFVGRNGVLYLPWHEAGVEGFVGPGYPRLTKRVYTAEELLLAGATPVLYPLWPRPRRRKDKK